MHKLAASPWIVPLFTMFPLVWGEIIRAGEKNEYISDAQFTKCLSEPGSLIQLQTSQEQGAHSTEFVTFKKVVDTPAKRNENHERETK